MPRSAKLFGFLGGVFLICAGSSAWAETGIVLYSILQKGQAEVKAGSIVEYSENGNKGLKVRAGGKEFHTYSGVIPLDPDFAPSRIYLELQGNRLPQSERETKTPEAKVDLADAALKVLKRSPAMEDVEAQNVRLTYLLISCQTEGKTTATDALTKAQRYLQHYPQGRYRDEFEWKIVVWSNEVYETEGEASIPLGQARSYQSFHAAHPNSSYSEEIDQYTAHAYRLGADLLDYGPNAETPGRGKPYRKKAESIYLSLLKSKDPVRAASARVALYNLRHGRVPGFATPSSPPIDW